MNWLFNTRSRNSMMESVLWCLILFFDNHISNMPVVWSIGVCINLNYAFMVHWTGFHNSRIDSEVLNEEKKTRANSFNLWCFFLIGKVLDYQTNAWNAPVKKREEEIATWLSDNNSFGTDSFFFYVLPFFFPNHIH